MTVSSLFASRRASTVLTTIIVAATAALLWFGYRAISEWQHAAAGVAGRRADAAVDLVVTAFARDMQGAQQILAVAERDGLTIGKAVDLLHPIASAFARYPYIETFFSWKQAPAGAVTFYSRAERRPAWLTAYDDQRTFPVIVGNAPNLADGLVSRVAKDAAQGRRFSIFDTSFGGHPTQVVALISYADPLRQTPVAVLGFVVDMEWVRANYFGPLIRQLARIEGGTNLQLTIRDEHGTAVFGRPVDAASPATTARRTFPMGFFEPLAMAVDPPADLALPAWTVEIRADQDPTLAAAELGARRTLLVSSAMAVVLIGALILTWKAWRASAMLSEMRSDFVSAVTHELKTPLANLRAINETLASERSTMAMSREYSQMGIRETQRLSRLVDNLLAYARITDVADAYAFAPVDMSAIVEQSVREFSPNLGHGGFAVEVDLPEKLPPVRGDATALNLMLNNLVDNAIRYSRDVRHLHIGASANGRSITLEVKDKGIGISPEDLPRVTRKFSRGTGSEAGGSGLGLAIVDRIAHDHGGTLRISSEVGAGTTVSITLPVAHS
jgi:signal transduction histidine kinase